MVLKNIKPVEEFNNNIYFKQLELLIENLITNNQEMIFLEKASKSIKDLEVSLINKTFTKPVILDSKHKDNHVTLPLNKFYTNNGQVFFLTKTENILLYEHLLKENINITIEDENLYEVISKSIKYVYTKKNANIETELIRFFNVPEEKLTFHLMHEINNLIKYHPHTKNYNLYKTRFKLTTLSHNIGNIFLEAFFESHSNFMIHDLLNEKRNNVSQEFNNLIEDLQQYETLNNNLYFQEIFRITVKKNKNKKTKIINNLITEKKEFSYNVGQYFYNIMKTLFLIYHKNSKDLSTILLKNKLTEYRIKIGSVFLHTFKVFDLFQENIVWVNKNKETILFVPNMQYFPNIVSNIVHQRPYFCYGTIETLLMKYEKAKTKLNNTEYYLYHICNTRSKLKIHKNPDIALKPTIKNSYKKLKMFSGKYYMENFETLTSFVATIDKQYFYNFLLMIQDFIKLKNTNNSFTFEKNLERYSNLFLLYKIQIKTLLEAYNTNNLIYKRLLEHVFEYALDFSLQNNTSLLKELEENLKPSIMFNKKSIEWCNYKKKARFIRNLYNKIYSYKIFLKGLLSECLIYVHFDYFIFDAFLDTRGRHYLNGFFMNPQSYPMIKAFVKPYTKNDSTLSQEHFNNIKRLMFKKPYIIESKEVFTLMEKEMFTYKNYIIKEAYLKLKYIHSLLENKTISLETLNKDLQELRIKHKSYTYLFEYSLIYIKKYMTNIKKLFVLHSAILLYLKQLPNIMNYYELDATASGLQMTSMVLRDATLGELCNLTLSQDKQNINYDLYLTFSQDAILYFYKYIHTINDLNISLDLKNVCCTIFDYFYLKIKKSKKEIICLIIQLKTLLTKEIYDKFYNILYLFKVFAWVIPFHYNHKNKSITQILKKAINIKNKKHVIYEILYSYIYIVGGFFFIKDLIFNTKTHNWFFIWLNNREVFKKAIMTFGYNATSYRRKQQFRKNLLDQHLDILNSVSINYFSNIFNNLFLVLKDIYLTSSQVIRDFGTLLTKKVKNYPHVNSSILIDNGIFEIEIKSYIKKESSLKVSGLLNNNLIWHELQLNNPMYLKKKIKFSNDNNISKNIFVQAHDPKTLARKFAPNFIHSMDAWLICSFKQKIAHLNKLLGNKLFINNFTNHDTFGISLVPFLKYFLMDIYKNIYFFDYLGTLHHNYNYSDILVLWFKKIMLNSKIRKLNYRKEAHLGSSVTLLYPLYVKNLGYHIQYDMGASTNLILNPYFVK